MTATRMQPSEVGPIPEGWRASRLGDLYTFRNGVNADKAAYGVGTPFVNILEVITRSHLRVTDVPGRVALPPAVRRSYAIRSGDIVFNRTSETQDEVGLAAVYLDDAETVFGGFTIRARPTSGDLDPRFAGYALRSAPVRRQMVARGQGAIHANIGQGDLAQVFVQVPPIVEQRAVAEALLDVDDLISAEERLVAKQLDLRHAMASALLSGRTRLAGFGRPWTRIRLDRAFALLPTANNPRADLIDGGDIAYVHYGDIHATSAVMLDCASVQLPRIASTKVGRAAKLRDGDLIVADASEDYGGIGKSVEVANVAGRHVVAGLHTFLLRGDRTILADGFKGHIQAMPHYRAALKRLATGISVLGISKSSLLSIELVLPELAEQRAIAAVLADADAQVMALRERLVKIRQVKIGMAQELLSGRSRLA